MNDDFATAMSRALGRVRAGDPGEATRLIQATLTGRPAPAGDAAPQASEPGAQQAGRPPIDTAAEEAEIVDEGREAGASRGKGTRRRLRDVVAGLRRGLPQGLSGQLPGGLSLPGMGGSSAPPAVPEGARYEWRSHSGAAGARDYRLYVPASLGEGAQGLVVMLHGCTQSPDDFANGTAMNEVAERHGLIVAYPSQTRGHNAQGCWNWFRTGDQGRDGGEPAILAGITRELVAEFGIDRARVFVAGLSAGGAMAAILGEAYPDLFAAVGVHSGLPAGSASDVVSAFAAMRGDAGSPRPARGAATGVRVAVFHGGADSTVHSSNGTRIIAAAREPLSAEVQQEGGTSAGGRSYTRTATYDAAGVPTTEHWLVEGAGHAWSGGSAAGSYTDPAGPDASAEMVRFFLAGPTAG